MRRLILVSVLLVACGGGNDGDSGLDAGPEVVGEVVADVAAEVVAEVTADVEVAPDLVEDETVAPVDDRAWTYKGMGGISMGACAFTWHVRHPGRLDTVAALGGYINYHYLQDFFLNMVFGGFCELADLEAHVEDLNDPEAFPWCGPVSPRHPWEFGLDFNHWHYDTSGVTTDRDFYWVAVQGIFLAFGNLASYNPDHPYLPPGVPESWAAPGNKAEKCANPVVVGKPHNYNAEYNPEGTYNLITFCDGEEPVPGGENNPDFWTLMGAFDPAVEHDEPVDVVLAVDINGNGKRDYHEPVVVNSYERFDDVGADGCANADEDGAGGCEGGGSGTDPNGDDYHMVDNPFGTEGNFFRDAGEPYEDFGLDGVADTGDFGEGDGEYSVNPALRTLWDTTVMSWLDNAPAEELAALDIIFDGGIRDALHALTSTWPLYAHLAARTPNTRIFDGYTGLPGAIYPSEEPTALLINTSKVDWSEEGIGKNFIVRYGNPEATAEEIEKGDGKHLGSDMDMLNRIGIMFLPMLHRWPDMDWSECKSPGTTRNVTFYSQAVKNRYAYSISLPPCYDAPDKADTRYPVYVYLPGHGITASDAIAGGVAFNMMMQTGKLPKFMLVVPEGQCCDIDVTTNQRYCVCRKNPDDSSVRDCLDPTCQGPEESCDVLQIPSANLQQECYGGHFFANQVGNKFGNTELADEMRYEDLLTDLLDHLDGAYRTK